MSGDKEHRVYKLCRQVILAGGFIYPVFYSITGNSLYLVYPRRLQSILEIAYDRQQSAAAKPDE